MAEKRNWTDASKNVIPGLVHQAFSKGSHHHTSIPALKSFELNDDGNVEVEWEARGSSVYKVAARGALKLASWDAGNAPRYKGLVVKCSCPDGARRYVVALERGTLVLCKHAYAALETVVDTEAEKQLVVTIRERKELKAAEEAKAKKQQGEEMPGERERLEYGMSKMSSSQIIAILRKAIGSVDGLQNVGAIFTRNVMPPKQAKHCARCKEDYGPQFVEDNVCRIYHPSEATRTMWDGSKKSWEHCERCGGNFDLDGFHSWGRNDVSDDGDYCFEGEHTSDQEEVGVEGRDGDV